MKEPADLVAIIEAAYDLEGEEHEWQRHLGEAALPALDRGGGLHAFSFDASDPQHVRCSNQIPIGQASEKLAAAATAMNEAVPSDILAHIFLSLACYGTASELSGQGEAFRQDPFYREFLHPHGMYDFLGVIGLNPPGTGVVLGAPLSSVESTSREERALWAKVAAHIAAAARLREVSGGDTDSLEQAEAILSPGGKIAHAEGPAATKAAREKLVVAAHHIEKAKGPLRHNDPSEALAHWPSLLQRRWTIHETEDTDGRRFLVARVNAPRPDELRLLTLPERQVAWYCAQNHPPELIAYELGMRLEDVEHHLDALAEQLGVERDDKFVAFLRAQIFDTRSQ